MCCVITCLLKCLMGVVASILMTIGVVLGLIGALLLWGFNYIMSAISPLQGQITRFLNDLGVQGNANDVMNLISTNASVIGSIALAIGVILVGFSVLIIVAMCCCSVKTLVIVIVILLSCVTVGLIVLIAYYGSNPTKAIFIPIEEYLKTGILDKYVGVDSKNPESIIVNVIQIAAQCCGISNYSDYNNVSSFNRSYSLQNGTKILMKFPQTCCDYDITKFSIDGITLVACMSTQYSLKMNKGCWSLVKPVLQQYLNYCFMFIGITIGILFAAIVVMIAFICCLDKLP